MASRICSSLAFGFLIEEGFGGHDDAVDAKTALRGLLGDKRLLQGVGLFDRSDAFECGDFRSRDRLTGVMQERIA